MSFFLKHMADNLWHGKFGLFPEDIVSHAVSTRMGGVSKAPYSSLNLGLHVGDSAEDVRRNREIFANSLNFKAEDIVTPEQVHGTEVLRVTEELKGRGSRDYGDAIPGTDALITDVPGIPLLLCFADCTPILFVDPEHHAIGIAHGGWKGTVKQIARKTLEAMEREFGTEPEKCLAGIGPSIGPCCYEVGEDVQTACREAFPEDWQRLLAGQKNGKPHFDLWEANRLQLLQAGMEASNIDCAAECTCCRHGWYFSYRADGGTTGRIGAMIGLREY
ncbi:MAG: peptidoglycan editing factor PgeF [Selenomonadaceae bacterium]|nr:peptidoglycan editing factor PgeF [Selenomonadaceae bacterium]MBR3457635.1 peptidoglycan editing factor PgeF [Selenomonadaceae bacterium]